ncbi:hypothetical protein JG687_00015971 [Phytophthora cactorum]|uniref:Uncharacterized protein n=1 Tax=Phytophthora cactorum TaxID=29920 RepID=A0A8T1TVK1_9STRA|nr:hypothetical protein JG687_00015971 [Phytophthora cactorum]
MDEYRQQANIDLEELVDTKLANGIFVELLSNLNTECKTKAPMIEIGKGQMLILRGGLPHAGATFDEANLCLHCYIRVDGVDQEEYTKAVTWECFRCSPIYSDAILSAIS